MDQLTSTCRRHHLDRRRTHVKLVVPMLPSRFDAADQFAAIKRLRQDVPSASIQSLAPKTLVCKSRCDDQGRDTWQGVDMFQHVDPRTRQEITLTKDNGNVVLL